MYKNLIEIYYSGGTLAFLLQGDKIPTTLTIDGLKYTITPGKNTVENKKAQLALLEKGVNITVDGIWGPTSTAAYETYVSENKNSNENSINWKKVGTIAKNAVLHPIGSIIDGALYAADRAGAPSNAMNFLRSVNSTAANALNPAKLITAGRAYYNAQKNGTSYDEERVKVANDPSLAEKILYFNPLENDNGNYSDEELEILRRESDDGAHGITAADIRRETGKYGDTGNSIFKYTTPDHVTQTSLGLTSGGNGIITDIYDFNTHNDKANKDNEYYKNKANWNWRNPASLFSYENLRAIAPYISANSQDSNATKIKTKITF